MSTGAGAWTVRLASAVEADFEPIPLWTREQFGDAQARVYSDIVSAAVQALIGGPEQPGPGRGRRLGEACSRCMSRNLIEGGGISCYSGPRRVLPIGRPKFSAFSAIRWISRGRCRRMNELGGQAALNSRLVD